ncbi:MAG: hypothetical protein K0S81_3200 [Rhodospirillales bacterium]|jgi:hypothetical protein|nr:hypothetical protein [Rhodospirillales bacterium]
MADILAPGQTSHRIHRDAPVLLTSFGARLALQAIGNGLLNRLRQRAVFNELMELSPAVRDDVGLTQTMIAARVAAVSKAMDQPLPGPARCIVILWKGLVIYGDAESRRCWAEVRQNRPSGR